MKCGYPIILKGRAFGCGQCISCRINQRRVWTHRLLLEASQYEHNAFVTLTYDEEHYPEGGSLCPADMRNYLKRLRKKLYPRTFRYFGAGEYGEKSEHPHYHLALFGTETCRRGSTALSRHGRACCENCTLHTETWGKGHVYLGSLTDQSAAYIVGYVTKKITNPKGEEELAGRHPEFARMSNRPGLGAGIMDEVASTLMQHRLEDVIEDVPLVLRHGKKLMPLGKYLRRRLRTRIGREANAPQSVLDKMEEEVRPVREAAFATAQSGFKELAFREALIAQEEGKTIRATRLHRLRNKTGTL